MKKYNYLFLLLLLPFALLAQLEGEYSMNEFSFSSTAFTFNNDGTFSLLTSHCTGQIYGSGTYTIHRKKLTLVFENNNPNPVESYFEIKDLNDEQDSIYYNLDIRTTNQERIAFAIVALSLKDIEEPSGTIADLDGKALLAVSKTAVPSELHVSYFGYNDILISIMNQVSKTIKVYLKDAFTDYVEAGTSWTYNIKKIKKNSFLLNEYGKKYLKYSTNNEK